MRLPTAVLGLFGEARKKMIWIVFPVLLVLWARGTAACSNTMSGLIENLAGHPVGRGVFTGHSRA
jgi:predicted small secreted protein